MDAAMTPTAAPFVGRTPPSGVNAAPAPTDRLASATISDAPRPASLEQSGRVTRAKLSDNPLPGARAVSEPERALKPYGVAMLPDRPVEAPTTEKPSDEAAQPTQADAADETLPASLAPQDTPDTTMTTEPERTVDAADA